jgi:hypothetical protein
MPAKHSPTTTVKLSDKTLDDIARLVERTGISRHGILIRLINLGLAQARRDWQALFTEEAIGVVDKDKAEQIEPVSSIAA